MPKNNLTTRNAAFGLRQSPASLDDTARTVVRAGHGRTRPRLGLGTRHD
ncbi:MAG: hypothetical protein ACLR7Z_10670 [Bilophila wadsworthia]